MKKQSHLYYPKQNSQKQIFTGLKVKKWKVSFNKVSKTLSLDLKHTFKLKINHDLIFEVTFGK